MTFPGVRTGSASRAKSHSSERVPRGSMISSTQKVSAVRNGERSLFSRSSISASLALRIVGGVDIGAVGRLDAAFQRQRAPATPTARRSAVKPPAGWCAAPATPKALRMMNVHHGTVVWFIAAMARTPWRMVAALLGLEPDQEAGAVAEIDDRQMERLGQVDEAHHLLAGIGGPGAAIDIRDRSPSPRPAGRRCAQGR